MGSQSGHPLHNSTLMGLILKLFLPLLFLGMLFSTVYKFDLETFEAENNNLYQYSALDSLFPPPPPPPPILEVIVRQQ